MNAAELREQITPRDARSVAATEVRFTDITAYVEGIKTDAAAGSIADQLVWLARTSGPATVEQVAGKWVVGGDREAPGWRSMYVEMSYLARGQLHKLSSYCGIVARDGREGEISQKTALKLRETEHRLQDLLSRLRKEHGIQARGGGALYLHDVAQPWQASPDQLIAPPASDSCAICGVAVHFANGKWRDDNGHYEAGTEMPCNQCASAHARGRSCTFCLGTGKRSKFDHEHTAEARS